MEPKKLLCLVAALCIALFSVSCGNDDDDDDPSDCGSGQIWLDGECRDIIPGNDDDDLPPGSPVTERIGPEGGELVVPNASLGVPPDAIVDQGEATYSVRPVTEVPAGVPEGAVILGDGVELSPSGVTFDTPVEVTLAVPEGAVPENVSLLRHDGAEWEFIGGEYVTSEDLLRGSVPEGIRGFTTRFSQYWPVSRGSGWRSSWSHVKFVNSSGTDWVNVCIQNYEFEDASGYPNSISPHWGVPVAPRGTIGWSNEIGSGLPAGTYTFQYETNRSGDSAKSCYRNASPVTVHANSYSNPQRIPAPSGGDASAGPCDCKQSPTPPLGEGALQFTLSWNRKDVDLDLRVTTPNDEEIGWDHPFSSDGGELDHDDVCEEGGPENIFWSDNPPTGEYLVEVHYFSWCIESGPVSFTLRINDRGTIRTYNGTVVEEDQRVEVTRYSR